MPSYVKSFRMEEAPNSSLFNIYLKITLVVSSYWIVSIILVFVNKYLLSSDELKLDAPLFVTWFQCIVAFSMCIILTLVSILSVPFTTVNFTQLRQVMPLSVMFVGMITFNNLCLQYVGVSFYYIGRSLTTVFNVVLSYTILRQTTSLASITCCGIIISGFFMGVDQEKVSGSLSIMGVIYGVLASFFTALYSIYIKKMLPYVQNDVVLLSFYNNLNAIFFFLPFIVLNGEVARLWVFPGFSSTWFWLMMMLGGMFGFVIGFLVTLQVKVTSPLTNNISGTAKACAQTVIATMWYHEDKPVLWWISNGIVLLGSAAYARVRQIEIQKEHSQKQKESTFNPPV